MKKAMKWVLFAAFLALQAAMIVLIVLMAAGVFATRGAAGQDGAAGDTPFIGENGNWWIGERDTGVAAKGEKGEKGDRGESYTGGHDWQESFTVEPRCEEPGVRFYTCTECEETKIEPLEPLGHDYEDGICTRCFKLQPDEGLRFQKADGGAGYIVSGIGSCESTDVVVPDTYDGKPVVGLKDSAFRNNVSITGIHLPAHATELGRNAFQGCSSLETVDIPAGVAVISDELFSGCSSLKEVVLPAGTYKVGRNAFYGCTSLSGLVLPEGVTTLMEGAFGGSGIESISLPAGISVLPEELFKDCTALTHVELPSSAVRVESFAFSGCTSLVSADLKDVVSVGLSAFNGCSGLREVVFGSGLTELGDHAFSGCAALRTVSLPEGLARIGRETFRGCAALKEIALPESLTELGDMVFYDCVALTTIRIPANVRSIGARAFHNCTSLRRLELAVTQGWQIVRTDRAGVAPREIGEEELLDPAAAAELFKQSYELWTWRR